MARFANIRPEQINKARRMLQDLPEKIERKTRQEAALLLESDLRKALKKGYGPKELCTLLKNEGIIIPTYLIRQFCSENDESLSESSLDIERVEDRVIPSSEDVERPEQPEVGTGIGNDV
ncbi:hypothetical protein [Desulfovibrio sp.]|uniref:hypothetical protein n=1 Tax=Desulfovibrio sp. TaxID=885 RepID=UPI003076B993